jgi:hypothetical protein
MCVRNSRVGRTSSRRLVWKKLGKYQDFMTSRWLGGGEACGVCD